MIGLDAECSERLLTYSVLHIAGLSAPRLGSMAREDEAFAYSSREFLRTLVVGKEVAFTITHTISNQSAGPVRLGFSSNPSLHLPIYS